MQLEVSNLQSLAIATAIGFLIGFQREWRKQVQDGVQSFAGARTFALVGLVGALCGLFRPFDALLVASGLIAVATLSAAAYWSVARGTPATGATTEVALLVTYLLGALATHGEPALAASGGVAVAILLALKRQVKEWTVAMDAREINAALRFLAISVIVLPTLPDRGFGPYEALNPRNIWLMVVLISGLSFLGYWLTKRYASQGVLLAGAVGGLASSTAATLSLARLAANGTTSATAAASGIVAANLVMILRVAVLLSATAPAALAAIAAPLAAAALAGAVGLRLLWRQAQQSQGLVTLGNPLQLRQALYFAALLSAISVATRFATDRFGGAGLQILAFLTGLGEMDAITLAMARAAASEAASVTDAGRAILTALVANVLVKAVMSRAIAGAAVGTRVGLAFAAILAAGIVAVWFGMGTHS